MRRRDLFTLTAAIAGGTVLGATGCTPHHDDASASSTAPIGFAPIPAWPGNRARARITAVRDRYLVGMAEVPEIKSIFVRSWVPVVVNVTGVTTWAVLIDDDGTWSTRKVTVKETGPGLQDSGARTELFQGPAVIDDTHAYLVVGVMSLGRPGAHSSPGDRCPVMLFKIRLADGTIVASTTVSDDFEAAMLRGATLTLTKDGGSLLLAGGNRSGGESGWMGLRLSAADLGVEFDARALTVGQEVRSVDVAGQGLLVSLNHPFSSDLIRLADGHRQSLLYSTALVLDDWVYQNEVLDQTLRLVATHVDTDEKVEVSLSFPGSLNGALSTLTAWSDLVTESRNIIDFEKEARLRVWQPGAPEPRFDFAELNMGIPQGVAVFDDILHTWQDVGERTRLILHHLDSGEILAERSLPQGLLGPGVGAVTTWGIVTTQPQRLESRFVRATEWLP